MRKKLNVLLGLPVIIISIMTGDNVVPILPTAGAALPYNVNCNQKLFNTLIQPSFYSAMKRFLRYYGKVSYIDSKVVDKIPVSCERCNEDICGGFVLHPGQTAFARIRLCTDASNTNLNCQRRLTDVIFNELEFTDPSVAIWKPATYVAVKEENDKIIIFTSATTSDEELIAENVNCDKNLFKSVILPTFYRTIQRFKKCDDKGHCMDTYTTGKIKIRCIKHCKKNVCGKLALKANRKPMPEVRLCADGSLLHCPQDLEDTIFSEITFSTSKSTIWKPVMYVVMKKEKGNFIVLVSAATSTENVTAGSIQAPYAKFQPKSANRKKHAEKSITNHEVYKSKETIGKEEESHQPKPIALAEGKKYTGKVIIHAKWGKGPNEFGLPEELEGDIFGPQQIIIRNDVIYMFDFENNRVLKYGPDGNYIEAIVLEKGINIPPALRNTDYPGVCTIFEKDKKVKFKPKILFFDKIYQSFPPNKCIRTSAISKMEVDENRNIFLTGSYYNPTTKVILKYNKNGKFISKVFDEEKLNQAEKEQFKQIKGPLFGLLIDKSGNLYLNQVICSGEKKQDILRNCKGTVVKISEGNGNKVKILDWAELDDKTKTLFSPVYIPDPAISIIDDRLKKLVECSLGDLLSPSYSILIGGAISQIAADKYGNIYEIVVCPANEQWKEGVRVIKWSPVQ